MAARERLWAADGAADLAYLRGRGLADVVIRGFHLGSLPPIAGRPDLAGPVVTWFASTGRPSLVKLRRLTDADPRGRYVELYRDRSLAGYVFPTPKAIRPGLPVAITEGEFDCLSLVQARLARVCNVVTIGSAVEKPAPALVELLSTCPIWYVAGDTNEGGETACRRWEGLCPTRAVRVAPPDGYKDWNACLTGGVDLAAFWKDRLAKG
jgi:hypothetical protein